MGYPKLPGLDGEAFRPPPEQRSDLAGQFADLLTALRAVPASSLHPDTPEWPGHDLEAARRQLTKHGHLVTERVPDLAVPEISRYLEGDVPTTGPAPGPAVISHCDIKPEHLLFDPERGRLTGVIDWADTCISHPTIDLGALAIWLGPGFMSEVAATLQTSPDAVDQALAAVRIALLAGLARTFAGEKHWTVDITTTMIRWAFGMIDRDPIAPEAS